MGCVIDYNQLENSDKSILNDLKNKVFLDRLIDCIDYIDDKISEEEEYLTKTEFKEFTNIFLTQLQSERLYLLLYEEKYYDMMSLNNETITKTNEKILKYEIYSLLILLSKGSFEAKTHSIFSLYTINNDNSLKSSDFILLIKSIVYSLMKVSQLPVPSDEEVIEFLKIKCPTCLESFDSFEINFNEFHDWVNGDDEIQYFLIEIFDIQTRYHAMKAYLKYLSDFEKIFDENIKHDIDSKILKTLYKKSQPSGNMPLSNDVTDQITNLYAELSSISKVIFPVLKKIDLKIETIFNELVDPENTSYVRKDRYVKVIKAISLFMAVDKDMSHSLNKSEMGTLIWLLSGEEPNDDNLKKNIDLLDSNGDSAIELSEWLDFLATKDNKGRRVINYTLKQKFDLYDCDGSGYISIDELEKMIVDSFSELLNRTHESNRKLAEVIIKDLSKIIMSKMDSDGSNNLDWTEFKNYLHVASCEEEKISEFLEKFILEA